MTDPEDPAAKNEQELNLFSDQPVPGNSPVEPESGEPAVSGEIPAEDQTAVQDIPVEKPAEQPAPETGVPSDDSPVVAPPPQPRKQPSPARPGLV